MFSPTNILNANSFAIGLWSRNSSARTWQNLKQATMAETVEVM